jgi:hypothetical protein
LSSTSLFKGVNDIRCQAASTQLEVSLTAVGETASAEGRCGSAGKQPVTERAKLCRKGDYARHLWTAPHPTSTPGLFGPGAGHRRVGVVSDVPASRHVGCTIYSAALRINDATVLIAFAHLGDRDVAPATQPGPFALACVHGTTKGLAPCLLPWMYVPNRSVQTNSG